MDFTFVTADSETNGIKPTRVFMVGVQCLITGQYQSFVGPDAVAEAYYRMSTESRIVVGHNFKSYDAKTVGKNLVGIEIPEAVIVDTLEMSRDLFPKMKNHKLETWGVIAGLPKLKSPLFEDYSPEMDTYCERDVRSNTASFSIMYRVFLQSHTAGLRFNHEALTRNAEYLAQSIIA
jgi:hypothetical protein